MELLDSQEAADFLGIESSTLYAYVSRGLLESVEDPEDARRRCYRKSDLERLKRRSDATSGHGAAAASALDWGAPVLETSISRITAVGPSYRETSLRSLVDDGRSVEEVAGLLWLDDPSEEANAWDDAAQEADELLESVTVPAYASPVAAFRHAVSGLALHDERRLVATDAARLRLARRLVRAHARVFTIAATDRRHTPDSAVRIAPFVASATETLPMETLRVALLAAAEHGLNASAFATRVAASTDADLYACITAGLSAMAGPLHGRAPDRGVRLLEAARQRNEPRNELVDRLRDGTPTPCFGHRLYPAGDPRYGLVVDTLREAVGDHQILDVADQLSAAAEELDLGAPNLALGLAVTARLGNLRRGAASGLFALGRTVGWVAHALEQYGRDQLLRPRARYDA